jgi:hypothetical protein
MFLQVNNNLAFYQNTPNFGALFSKLVKCSDDIAKKYMLFSYKKLT